MELCKGMPLCRNKEDLKWCKSATTWTVPENWKPLADIIFTESLELGQLTKCSFLNNDTDQGKLHKYMFIIYIGIEEDKSLYILRRPTWPMDQPCKERR